MTGRINPFPFFPKPPTVYNPAYLSTLITAFSTYVQQINTPGEGRHTNVVLTNLPTDDYAVEAGTLFQVLGAVRISLPSMPYVRGTGLTCYGGTVTITP